MTRKKLQGTGRGWKTHSHHGNEVGNPSGHRVSLLVSIPAGESHCRKPRSKSGKTFSRLGCPLWPRSAEVMLRVGVLLDQSPFSRGPGGAAAKSGPLPPRRPQPWHVQLISEKPGVGRQPTVVSLNKPSPPWLTLHLPLQRDGFLSRVHGRAWASPGACSAPVTHLRASGSRNNSYFQHEYCPKPL